MDSNWWDREAHELCRRFRLKNGNAILFIKQMPYGFWTIHFERGHTPPELSGTFSTFGKAKDRFEAVLSERRSPNPIIAEEEISREDALNATFRRNGS